MVPLDAIQAAIASNCSLSVGVGVESKTALPFSHHLNHLDAVQCGGCRYEGFKAKHWPDTPLDPAMVLLDPVI